MRLYTYCHKCKKKIRFSSWESDRVELSKSKGERIELTCKNCGYKGFYHVNSVKAIESKSLQIISLTVYFLGTPLMLIWFWDYILRFTYIYVIAGLIGLLGVPFMLYSVIEREEKEENKTF